MKKSEIKELIKEILEEELSEGPTFDPSRQYGEGYALARKDDAKEIERPLDPKYYTHDFIKGYKQYRKDIFWQKWTNRLTNLASDTGHIFRNRE